MKGRKQPGKETVSEHILPDECTPWSLVKEHVGRYAFAARFASDKLCLDIGCGSGYGSSRLVRSGARAVVGADISPEAIQAARSHYGGDGPHFLLADAQQLPFEDESFDAVVAMETIEHLPAPGRFLGECYRVLKQGGWFICSTPNKARCELTWPNPFPVSRYHFPEFYIDELRSLAAEKRFGEIALYGQGFINADAPWKLRVFVERVIRGIILALPKGESIADFLTRAVLRRRYVKLEELTEEDLRRMSDDNIGPLPHEGRVPETILLVARR